MHMAMARPLHADAGATRARILGAASALFSSQGMAQTTMRQIAASAEVSLATVHHYFGGKEALYLACVDAMYAELDALAGELESAARSSSGALEELVDQAMRQIYAFARRHRHAVQLLLRTVLDTGALDPDRRERHLLPFLERTTALVCALTQRDARQVRFALLSLNYLIVRFALNTPAEQGRVIGEPDASEEEAIQYTEDYLVALARRELLRSGEQ